MQSITSIPTSAATAISRSLIARLEEKEKNRLKKKNKKVLASFRLKVDSPIRQG